MADVLTIHLRKKVWAVVLLLFLGISCHSNYVAIEYTLHHGASWNNDHTCIAFVASKKAYLSATGLSRFPDGGTPDCLVEEIGLYLYNPEDRHLTQLATFNDLAGWLSANRSLWKTTLTFQDANLYYRISPVTQWDFYLSRAKKPEKRLVISNLKEKYAGAYAVDINTGATKKIDPERLYSMHRQNFKTDKISLTALNKTLEKMPLEKWGLVVQDIYPKSDQDYIEETIYLKNTSPETRRAVIEQILSKKSNVEIKAILKKMDNYKASLKGLKKKEYELYSKDTYHRIKNLL